MCFSKEKIRLKKLLNVLPSLLFNNHFIMNNSGQVPPLLSIVFLKPVEKASFKAKQHIQDIPYLNSIKKSRFSFLLHC